MNNERIAQLLSYAEKHLKHPKIFNFRSFTERILLKVEHVVNDLHDDGVLTPSEEMIKLLNRMCTRVYDLSVHCLKKGRTQLVFALDHILFHLINIRKFCLFPNLEVPMLL